MVIAMSMNQKLITSLFHHKMDKHPSFHVKSAKLNLPVHCCHCTIITICSLPSWRPLCQNMHSVFCLSLLKKKKAFILTCGAVCSVSVHHHHHLSLNREKLGHHRWFHNQFLLFFIIRWVTGKVQPDGAHPSPGQTYGPWVHCGTLPSIWPLLFELWRYPSSDAMLTPAISPLTGRLMEGRNILFLPIQVQRTCTLPTVHQHHKKELGCFLGFHHSHWRHATSHFEP